RCLLPPSPLHYCFGSMLRRPPSSTPFPTRRSSDLGRARVAVQLRRPAGDGRIAPARRGRLRALRLRLPQLPGRRGIPPRDRAPRSEEHTSELQSRENLVCRLLLEKKKKEQCRHKIT